MRISAEQRRSAGKRLSVESRSGVAKKPRQSMCTPQPHNIDSISPKTLALKLEEVRKELEKEATENVLIELTGFDLKNPGASVEEFARKREEIRQHLKNFDTNGRTELNLDAAAIGGAKLMLNSVRGTRSFCKMLEKECGIGDDVILFKGLPENVSEKEAIEEVKNSRLASLVESYVDLHRQIQFKTDVLNFVAKNKQKMAKSEGRVTRKAEKEAALRKAKAQAADKKKRAGGKKKLDKNNSGMHTPTNTIVPDPLDDKKIVEKYALEVASEICHESRKRKIAPIPFRIDLLDDEEDE